MPNPPSSRAGGGARASGSAAGAESKRASITPSQLSRCQAQVLELIAGGAPLNESLELLARLIEAHMPGVLASILLLDEDGLHIRHAAAPSLPAAYREAIDGVPVGPNVGSCGTAVHRREPVITADIATDPLWKDYRDLALPFGLRASWSAPIFDAQRRVLGSFALYFRKPGRPSPRHVQLIDMATHTAAIAIARDRDERERARLVGDLGERVKELTVLHGAAQLLVYKEDSLSDGLLARLADLLPKGFRFPGACAARIRYGRHEAHTRGWRETARQLTAGFVTSDGTGGTVTVAYVQDPPHAGEPFLPEERQLIASLADMLAAHLERVRIEASLQESEALFRAAFENAAVGITLTAPDTRIVNCNPAFARMLGMQRDELVGRPFSEFTHPEDLQGNLELFEDMLAGRSERFQINKRYLRKDGSLIWVQLTVSRLPPRLGQPPLTIGMVEDITERKQAEERIEYLATHDRLTALPNRALIQDRLAQSIMQARRGGQSFALMCVDLDRFKVINDGFGHPFGDRVLQAAGQRLVGAVREADTVARQGGDEFLVLLAGLRKPEDAYRVAQKIIDVFRLPFDIDGREVHVSASVGVASYPEDGETAEALITSADVAMYRAKDTGRNAYRFFTREMSEETQRRVEIETELRMALARGQMHLVFQPKADLASGAISGCEALLRWTHPTLGAVSPARFIPIAEDSGLIVPVGDWVLRSACAQNKAWQEAGLPAVPVSVNLSARQFLQQDVATWVLQTLAETGLHPQWLELELTESLIAQDTEKAIETVNRLSNAGVKFSIDDFGTGYSNLGHLKRFAASTLKIDQSFVRNMLTDADDAAIALAVISLAHSLRMQAIAEGVESAEQGRFLKLKGCDGMQGYYFSRPVPAAELGLMLKTGKQLEL